MLLPPSLSRPCLRMRCYELLKSRGIEANRKAGFSSMATQVIHCLIGIRSLFSTKQKFRGYH
jgi:hypothetical protein